MKLLCALFHLTFSFDKIYFEMYSQEHKINEKMYYATGKLNKEAQVKMNKLNHGIVE